MGGQGVRADGAPGAEAGADVRRRDERYVCFFLTLLFFAFAFFGVWVVGLCVCVWVLELN